MKALVCAAVTLAASPLQAQQPAAPGGYEAAVAARLSGDPVTAVRLLGPMVAANPADSDAQVQLGYALLALDQLDEAERAFRAALAAAPAYSDARLGLARIAQRRGDRPTALREIQALDPTSPEVRALRTQLSSDPQESRWALDMEGSYGFVDGPQADWREVAIQLRHRFTPRTAGWGRVEVSRRFDRTDVYGEVGVDQAVGSRGRFYLVLGGTPDADFRPRWQLGLGGSLRLKNGANATVLTLDARHADLVVGDVQTVSPGIEQYLFGGRAWVTARWISLFDEDGEHQSGYLLRGDVQANDRLRVFVGLSDAPDTSEGVVVDTRSYFGGISYDFTDRVTGRLSAGIEDRQTGADRTQIGLGFGWRF